VSHTPEVLAAALAVAAVEEPKAEGSIPSWRAIAEGTGRYVSTRISGQHMSSSDPPAVPTMATDPRT
jgi:hypothetical protein